MLVEEDVELGACGLIDATLFDVFRDADDGVLAR